MNRLFSIALSFTILLQSLGFQLMDIAQFDELIEHAQYHNQQYGDSILVFISKHYGELKSDHVKQHQEEQKDHEKLPFNHSSCSHSTSISAFVFNTFKHEFNYSDFSENIEANYHYHAPNSSLHDKGLLQPPRLS